MILYFSGTGNTKYIAESLADFLDEEAVDLLSPIKSGERGEFYSENPFILVAPTYGWRVPRFLMDYLKKSKFSGNKDIYVIMNYGSSSGNANEYIKKDVEELGLCYRGLYGIQMPENYLFLFPLDSDETNRKIVEASKSEILKAGQKIKENRDFDPVKVNLIDRFLSGIVNDIFYKFILKDKKFYVTEKCIKCGQCADFCVLNNIGYKDGLPEWNGNCTHCMACFSKCPTRAIEYGKNTVGKESYHF